MYYSLFETALGFCGIVYRSVEDGKVIHILLPRTRHDTESRIEKLYPEAEEVSSTFVRGLTDDIVRFLSGEQVEFSMHFMDTSVCYPFQLRVITAERTIPRGMTASYGWVAKQIDTKGVRAVGNALARNPFPLVVPCHRAIRSDRTLGGFQGGLEMKRRLLEMEGIEFHSHGRVSPEYILT
jgi:methylated-DNA-[protein]-cysteine S-methyltransferase